MKTILVILVCALPFSRLWAAPFEIGAQFAALSLTRYSDTGGRYYQAGLPLAVVPYAKWFASKRAAFGPFALLSAGYRGSYNTWLVWAGAMATYYPTGHNLEGYFVEGKLGMFDASWGPDLREAVAGIGAGYQWLKDRPFVLQVKVEYEQTIPSRENAIGVSFGLSRRIGGAGPSGLLPAWIWMR